MPHRVERAWNAKEHYKRLGRTKEVHEDDYSDGDWWSDNEDTWWEEQPAGDEAEGNDEEEDCGMVAHSSFHLIDALEAASARRREQLAQKRETRGAESATRAKHSAIEADEASLELREVLRERGVKLGSLGKLSLLELRRIEAATRMPVVEEEEDAAAAETEALSVMGEFAAVAPDDENGGLPSPAIALPLDCWTEIVPFLRLEPILHLSHASQTLRGLVEDTGVWRNLWKMYTVTSISRVTFRRRVTRIGEGEMSGVPLSELPYQYRWSGLWSLRRAVMDLQMNQRVMIGNPRFWKFMDAKRVLDAEAWRELYEMTHSELVAQWSRLMANKAAGNPNLALKIFDSLDVDALPTAVKKMLRVPSTEEERQRLQSELLVDSLSYREEDEQDVTAADVVALTPMSVVNDVEEYEPNPRKERNTMPDHREPGEGGRRFHCMRRRPYRGERIAPSVQTQIDNIGKPDRGPTSVLFTYSKVTGLVNSRNEMSARIARYADTNPVDIRQQGPPENGPFRANGPYKQYDAREYYDTPDWMARRW